MNRDALGPALIAFLCILALGVGASSLDSQTSAGSDVGSGGGSGGGIGTGSTFSTGQPHPAVLTEFPTIPKIVLQLLMAALLVGFLVALYLQRDDLRRFAIVVVGLLVAAMLLLWALLSLSVSGNGGDISGGGGRLGDLPIQLPGGGGRSPSNEVQTVVSDPPVLVLALIVGVLVVGIAVVFLRPTADDDSTPEPESEPTEPETVAELGRAAGRAADRIDDDTDPTNEVYRAWHEMTSHLAVSNPQSSTPGEFARAAADAGMAREDVDELTALFETTRYGGNDATEARETRAVDALRRIEDEYGEIS